MLDRLILVPHNPHQLASTLTTHPKCPTPDTRFAIQQRCPAPGRSLETSSGVPNKNVNAFHMVQVVFGYHFAVEELHAPRPEIELKGVIAVKKKKALLLHGEAACMLCTGSSTRVPSW